MHLNACQKQWANQKPWCMECNEDPAVRRALSSAPANSPGSKWHLPPYASIAANIVSCSLWRKRTDSSQSIPCHLPCVVRTCSNQKNLRDAAWMNSMKGGNRPEFFFILDRLVLIIKPTVAVGLLMPFFQYLIEAIRVFLTDIAPCFVFAQSRPKCVGILWEAPKVCLVATPNDPEACQIIIHALGDPSGPLGCPFTPTPFHTLPYSLTLGKLRRSQLIYVRGQVRELCRVMCQDLVSPNHCTIPFHCPWVW